jgi:thymidylate synthase ThyX
LGVFGNGRFFEGLLQKLNCHPLAELQEIAKKSHEELAKVIPSFIRRAEITHKHQKSFTLFRERQQQVFKKLAMKHAQALPKMEKHGVRLVGFDPDAPVKVAAALLFAHSHVGLLELQEYCKTLSFNELREILHAECTFRENRRHKSPRALEHAVYTFEILADFGIYRDLQRHRMLTQERQLLTCKYAYFVPEEIVGTEMENTYHFAMERAKETYDVISKQLPEEAQYVVPMGFGIHWYFHINLRALQWLCELRSSPAGHPAYRFIAQELAKEVMNIHPLFTPFFKFVDFEGHDLGRLNQEIRLAERSKL